MAQSMSALSSRSVKTAESTPKSKPTKPTTGVKRPATTMTQSICAADMEIAKEGLRSVVDPLV